MAHDDIPEDRCENPCPADYACSEYAEYWRRMVAEGLYDPARGEWTDAAIHEACK